MLPGVTTTTWNEIPVWIFQITGGMLAAFFLYYGMDVRRKDDASDSVAARWQALMKLCSFSLAAAKRTLGRAQTRPANNTGSGGLLETEQRLES